MKRILAACVAAALAAPALAQQPPAKSDTMTLSGPDGKTHTYKIVRTSKAPNGGTSYEVKDTVTGEVMTVVDESAKADATMPKSTEPAATPKQLTPSKTIDRTKSTPAAQPDPAPRRWFNWFRKDQSPSKSMPVQTSQMQPPPGENVALYDRDPIIRLIGSLADDILPSMREISAETLTRVGKNRPEVVEALVRSAQTDPAPSVRVCCCRCLVTLQVRTPECTTALHAMHEGDNDDVVRNAAAAALEVLDQ
jgi:hypothetical protein